MHGHPAALEWLAHRAGVRRLEQHPFRVVKYALRDNDEGAAFIAAYGKKEFNGLVGFVDLTSFSNAVRGFSPSEIDEFLSPFLTRVYDRVSEDAGLVDKMIGDEVMFVIPDYAQDGGASVNILGARFLAGLRIIQRELGPKYRMRVGLGYGLLRCSHFVGKQYSEWSIVGETVHLAKRLHGLPLLLAPEPIACAVGIFDTDPGVANRLETLASFLVNMPFRAEPVPHEDMAQLKGISPARAIYLLPND